MTELMKKSFIVGISCKLNRGEDLEGILASYTKLSAEDKETLRAFFKNGKEG